MSTATAQRSPTVGERLALRPTAGPVWNVWRAILGVAYLGAAAFNSLYTFPRGEELDGYADGAWFGFLGDFIRDVFMPNHEVFMSLVILFEVGVGVLILARGVLVDVGIVASVLWVLAVLPFLAWPYLVTNLVLAAIQGVVMLRRYKETPWRSKK